MEIDLHSYVIWSYDTGYIVVQLSYRVEVLEVLPSKSWANSQNVLRVNAAVGDVGLR